MLSVNKYLSRLYFFSIAAVFICVSNAILLGSLERIYGVFGHYIATSFLLGWFLFIHRTNKSIVLATFITYLLILIPVYILAIGRMTDEGVDYKEINRTISECNLSSIILSLVMMSIAICSSRAKHQFIRNIVRFFISALYVIFLLHTLVIIMYTVIYGVAPSIPSLSSILQTNIREAYEYIISKGIFIKFAAIALIIATPFYALTIFNFQRIHLANKASSLRSTFLIIVISSFILPNLILEKAYASYIYLWRVVHEQYKFKEALDSRAKMFNDLDLNANDAEDGLFVVVIGESLSRDYMSLYGYDKNTTPWQRSKLSDSYFYRFNNSYSCHVHTMFALSKALTSMSQYDSHHVSMADCPSIIEVAKAYGYEVSWISNQSEFGFYEGPQTVIANSASNKIFLNKHNYDEYSTKSNHYDNITIPAFKTILNSDAKKRLVFIHLMGQHADYKSRYPLAFSKWGDENHYINSVLFNDSVIKQLYSLAKDSKDFKAFVYFSDHGEDISIGHSAEAFTFSMARIPFWISLSEIYAQENGGIIQAINDNLNKPFTNDILFDILCGLTKMTSNSFYRSRFDITSKDFDLQAEDVMIFNTYKVIDDPIF